MAKPIKITATEIDAALAKAREQLESQKSIDGKIKVEVKLPALAKRANIQFTPVAYAKMLSLIQGFATEVAWHGIVSKLGEGLFRISDILVYPQSVTGATVRTDERVYTAWLLKQEDDVFNNLRMQSHSHANMKASPSPQDLTDQGIILDQMGSGCKFYIFMIWNKKLEFFIRVYDLEANLLYETEDVDVSLCEEGTDLEAFFGRAKELVEVNTPGKTSTKIVPATQYPADDYPFPGYDDEPPGYGRGYPGVAVRTAGKGGKRK